MNLIPVIALLRQEIGLNPASIGESAVAHALRRRIVATGCGNEENYVARLSSSQEEVQELIEEVIVPETWFFREEGTFECLRSHVRQTLLSAGKLSSFSVACLPCATGEEAYSIVMALLDMGLAPSKFRVHALDISSRALIRAQQAVYGEYSFRTTDKTFRVRYFQAGAGSYQLIQAVRDQVSFYQGSALAMPPPFDSVTYDVVFCRNLLIYLDDLARKRVVAGLKMMLAPDGILLLGHAEASIALQEGFERSAEGALRLRQCTARLVPQWTARKQLARPATLDVSELQAQNPMPFAAVSTNLSVAQNDTVAPHEIKEIRALADAGRLDEARLFCEARLHAGERSADLYCLLGLILTAQRDVGAARECYRKAMYLNPQHAEARQQVIMADQRSGLDRRSLGANHENGSRRREDDHG